MRISRLKEEKVTESSSVEFPGITLHFLPRRPPTRTVKGHSQPEDSTLIVQDIQGYKLSETKRGSGANDYSDEALRAEAITGSCD